jgi:hypothetical protein
LELHYAEVIDNDSTGDEGITNGSIKIKIPYMMKGILDNDLPWALPFHLSTGGATTHGISNIPEIGSLVWVFFYEQPWQKKPYYIADVNLKEFGASELFETEVKSNISGFSSNYPDVKFMHLKNGINIAVSSNDSTPEVSIYHPSGAYIFINSTGEIQLKGNTGSLEYSLLGETTKQMLSNILDYIIAHKHLGVTAGGATSGVADNVSNFTIVKTTTLPTTISQSVKNS